MGQPVLRHAEPVLTEGLGPHLQSYSPRISPGHWSPSTPVGREYVSRISSHNLLLYRAKQWHCTISDPALVGGFESRRLDIGCLDK